AGSSSKAHSGETAKVIDEEIKRIIDECYGRAKQILEDNRDRLELMKDALLEYETIDADQINDIMGGHKPRPPADWHSNDSGSGSARSSRSTDDKSPSGD